MTKKPEAWLRGQLPDVHALLQPVAHALIQAQEEVEQIMAGFPYELLWQKPAGLASPGFHLQHLAGVLSRLFTYARAGSLSDLQLQMLYAEGKPPAYNCTVQTLVNNFSQQVNQALDQLRHADVNDLTHIRGVGRALVPSTVIGLYTHAAEHTMRHVGQLLVTVKVLTAMFPDTD